VGVQVGPPVPTIWETADMNADSSEVSDRVPGTVVYSSTRRLNRSLAAAVGLALVSVGLCLIGPRMPLNRAEFLAGASWILFCWLPVLVIGHRTAFPWLAFCLFGLLVLAAPGISLWPAAAALPVAVAACLVDPNVNSQSVEGSRLRSDRRRILGRGLGASLALVLGVGLLVMPARGPVVVVCFAADAPRNGDWRTSLAEGIDTTGLLHDPVTGWVCRQAA
jgi:amino acid permease